MRRLGLNLFFMMVACGVHAQITVGLKLSGGHSLVGEKNLFSTKANGSLGIFLDWNYSSKLLGYSELSTTVFQNENPYLKWKRMDVLSCGVGLDILEEKNKLRIFLSPLLAYFTLKPQENTGLRLFTSHWSQWGLKLDAYYFIRKQIGFSLSYTHCFAHIYDTDNFQSILNGGVVFRWQKWKHEPAKVNSTE